MTPTPTTPQPNEDPRTARLRAAMDELLDMGMDIARTLHRRITAAAEAGRDAETAALPPTRPAPEPDLTFQFDRVARAVRRTVALSRALDAPPPQPAEPPHPANDPARQTAARKRIIRAVENNIHQHAEGPAADHLRAELAERLDAEDLADDIATRPAADIVIDIIRDLGIQAMQGHTGWKRRAPAELAHLAARAARRPGDPPLPEPAPGPAPQPLGRSRRVQPPPPLVRQGLALLARHEAAPLPPSRGQGGAGGGFEPTAGTPHPQPPHQADTSSPPGGEVTCPA